MKKKLLFNIPNIINLFIIILTIITIINFGVLSTKYITLIIIAEIILFLLGLFLYNRKNKVLFILGIILVVLSIIGNSIAYYYVSKTNNYLERNFSVQTYTVNTNYYLVGSLYNDHNNLNDITTEDTIYYYKFSQSVNKALEKIKNNEPIEIVALYDIMNNVKNDNSMLLVSQADFDYVINASNELSKEDFKIISEFEVTEHFKINNKIPEVYNVYINGLDYSGNRRDFNMIATINTKTNQVVLTSIPRDFYLYVPAFDMNDSLSGLGNVDSQVAKEALEKLFDIKIDYTLNLYTESLVKVVDTIGGVEFCSDNSFYTTHDLTLGSYDDNGEKLLVKEGCHTYNGLEALAIARERLHIQNGDRGRIDNDRQILKSIMNKLASIDTVKNYNEVLDSLDGTYTSNINKKIITTLIKKSIDNPNYEIIEQSVDGTDTMAIGRQGTGEVWALEPKMDTVNNASDKIKEVLNNK